MREIERVSERASERERVPTEHDLDLIHLLFVKPPRIAFIKFVRLLVVAKALLFLVPGICRHDVHEDLRPRFALLDFGLVMDLDLGLLLVPTRRAYRPAIKVELSVSLSFCSFLAHERRRCVSSGLRPRT